jgi:hypothetical protein
MEVKKPLNFNGWERFTCLFYALYQNKLYFPYKSSLNVFIRRLFHGVQYI